jgi:hypothetical protein
MRRIDPSISTSTATPKENSGNGRPAEAMYAIVPSALESLDTPEIRNTALIRRRAQRAMAAVEVLRAVELGASVYGVVMVSIP